MNANVFKLLIDKYGQTAEVSGAGLEPVRLRAFIQRTEYERRKNVGDTATEIGLLDESRYLYIGPAMPRLGEIEGAEVKTRDKVLKVERAEQVYIRDQELYCWAVLSVAAAVAAQGASPVTRL